MPAGRLTIVDEAEAASISEALRNAFVAAFSGYVIERARGLGVDPDVLAASIEEGARWLDNELARVLCDPFASQRQSPLEIFRSALEHPTHALTEAGVETPRRDPAVRDALPEDVYDLAPASSQSLGEAAWKAHIAWGIAKAETVPGAVPAARDAELRGSSVALIGVDLMDRTKIGNVVAASGLELLVWRNPAGIETGLEANPPSMALVDLSHPHAEDAIARISGAGVTTIAFGPHVDDAAMTRAGELGAAEVLPRSRFFRRLPDLLPKEV